MLGSHWRCVNPVRLKARYWPDRLHGWPVLSRTGQPQCDGCRAQVEKAGPRSRPRSFVTEDTATGRELLRFPVGEDDTLELGRGGLRYGIDLAADELDPPERSPGSAAATSCSPWRGPRTAPGSPPPTWSPATERCWNARARVAGCARGSRSSSVKQDRLVLADVVTLRLSGQRYVTDEQQARPRLGATGGGLTMLG